MDSSHKTDTSFLSSRPKSIYPVNEYDDSFSDQGNSDKDVDVDPTHKKRLSSQKDTVPTTDNDDCGGDSNDDDDDNDKGDGLEKEQENQTTNETWIGNRDPYGHNAPCMRHLPRRAGREAMYAVRRAAQTHAPHSPLCPGMFVDRGQTITLKQFVLSTLIHRRAIGNKLRAECTARSKNNKLPVKTRQGREKALIDNDNGSCDDQYFLDTATMPIILTETRRGKEALDSIRDFYGSDRDESDCNDNNHNNNNNNSNNGFGAHGTLEQEKIFLQSSPLSRENNKRRRSVGMRRAERSLRPMLCEHGIERTGINRCNRCDEITRKTREWFLENKCYV